MWKLGICTILGAAAFAALPVSPSWSPAPSLSLDKANARIGHPLSPGSVAGVNRRVNRREARRDYYGYGAAGAAAGVAAGAAYYGGGGLYDYAPVMDTTSAATTASSPVPLTPAEHASCMSRTFGAGPC